MPNGVKQGRVSAFTEHVDVMPTMLEWLGFETPRQCDGRSLQSFLHGRAAPERLAHGSALGIRLPRFRLRAGAGADAGDLHVERGAQAETKYVHFADLPPLLFDLRNDPGELVDLAQDERHQLRMADYSRRLLSWRMRHTDKTLSHLRVTPQTGLMNLNERGAVR